MTFARTVSFPLLLGVCTLPACQPKNVAANPPVHEVAATPPPAAAAKMVTMVCRNSQTGASVACGTPNAVMVGTKEP